MGFQVEISLGQGYYSQDDYDYFEVLNGTLWKTQQSIHGGYTVRFVITADVSTCMYAESIADSMIKSLKDKGYNAERVRIMKIYEDKRL